MKMIYSNVRPASRHFARRPPPAFLLGLLVLVCALLLAALTRPALGELFWRMVAPALALQGGGEAERLRGELAALEGRLADRDALFAENLELKSRLGRNSSSLRVLAGVIARPPALPYDVLLIDAGVAEGIAEGDLVSAGGTAIVGSVSEVYESSARVVLLSAAGEEHDALLVPRAAPGTSIPVSAVGQGSGSLTIRVPAGTPAQVGDSVLLPGISSVLAAQVSHVEQGSGESFMTLYLTLPANPSQLRLVEVLVK